MNFFQIETFLMISKMQSISRASELLYLSQPTVSQRLKSLEEEIGFSLIVRKKGYRNIELTPKGEQFIPIAKKWMDLWTEIQRLSMDDVTQPLTLGCMDTLNAYVLPPLYKRIKGHNQKALFDLKIKTQDIKEIYRMVETKEIDIGLVFQKIPINTIITEELFSEKLYIIKLMSDPSEIRTAYHPSELDPTKEIFFNSSPTYQSWHDNWWSPSLHAYIEVDTEALILEFMDHEEFWSVVPISVVKAFEKHAHIKAYEILDPPEDRICYKITHKSPKESQIPAIRLFTDYLNNYIEELDHLDNHQRFFSRS